MGKAVLRVCVCWVSGIFLAGIVEWSSWGAVHVTQHHNHLSRDGLYIDPAFTKSNATNLFRDTNFDGTIVGTVYAQALYIEEGPRGRAVIIAVTASNSVYSLDAFTGKTIWKTNVAPPVPRNALPCGNFSSFGITGTPVVDLPSRRLCFSAFTQANPAAPVKHMIYAMDVDTGLVNPGWPIDVNSNAVYLGVKFLSQAQGQRAALTVIGNNLYVAYGGLAGDCGAYYGWVVGVPLNTPAGVFSWATTAPRGGGIWGVGGIASDGVDPFVATGNTFSTTTWSGGEAIFHLQPNLTVNGTAYFWAPTNWLSLDGSDSDIGGCGPVLVDVPGATPSQLVVALGKDGFCYLLNRTNLGGISVPVAKSQVASSEIIQAAATYHTALGTYVVFNFNARLWALRIGASTPPTITSVWNVAEGGNASPFVTSTDGTNNVIVWGYGAESDQRLHAFDGDTGTTIYSGGGTRELMAGTHRFSTGIAARGRIYVANDNKVYSFQLPGQKVTSVTLTGTTVTNGGFAFSFTNVPGALFNVFSSTNVSQPLTNWTWLGEPAELSPGQFQFNDSQPANSAAKFYRVSSP